MHKNIVFLDCVLCIRTLCIRYFFEYFNTLYTKLNDRVAHSTIDFRFDACPIIFVNLISMS